MSEYVTSSTVRCSLSKKCYKPDCHKPPCEKWGGEPVESETKHHHGIGENLRLLLVAFLIRAVIRAIPERSPQGLMLLQRINSMGREWRSMIDVESAQ